MAPSQTFWGWEDLCISEGACAPLLPGDTQEVIVGFFAPQRHLGCLLQSLTAVSSFPLLKKKVLQALQIILEASLTRWLCMQASIHRISESHSAKSAGCTYDTPNFWWFPLLTWLLSTLAAPPVSRNAAEESVGPLPASTSLQDAATYHLGIKAFEAGDQCSSAWTHRFPGMSFSPQDIMHLHHYVTPATRSLRCPSLYCLTAHRQLKQDSEGANYSLFSWTKK